MARTIHSVLESRKAFDHGAPRGKLVLDADVYYSTTIPSEVHGANVAAVAVAALILTALATVYPATRAARTAPAEALRYE